MKLNKINIGLRLGGGFAITLALMLLLAASGLYSAYEIQNRLDYVVNNNVAKLDLVNTMSKSIHIVLRDMRTLVLLDDSEQIENERRKIFDTRKKYDAARQALNRFPASEAGMKIRGRIDAAQDKARPLNNKVIELAIGNKDAEALEILMREAAPTTQQWLDVLEENVALQREANEQAVHDAHEAYKKEWIFMVLLTASAITLSILIAWILTRSITRPINNAIAVAKLVASGDLRQSIIVEGTDETAQLMRTLKEMNESLLRIVGAIRSGTEVIATASGEIASGNLDLSSRTEQQASSLEETASSMEELTSTVKQNADNALQANQLALSASALASKGGDVVADAVRTMDGITESARKITDIIAVIDGIAFQTNILALNAAVEAARAGEQGKGFAVVASEVRTLAQRSAGAAKEIKELIGDSVTKVDAGAKLVHEAGSSMEEIVSSIKRVTDIVDEITAASREQAAGISQVNNAITQMDQVTQQNSGLVEEAAAAAESLQEQAGQLLQAVSMFRIVHEADFRTPEAAKPPAPLHVVASVSKQAGRLRYAKAF